MGSMICELKYVNNTYIDYLQDESLIQGFADTISFPEDEEDVIAILKHMNATGTNVTVQGARTGLCGGAVPYGGHILNMSKMNAVTNMRYDEATDSFILTVQSGITLQALNQAIAQRGIEIRHPDREAAEALQLFRQAGQYFFPPDPTETLATIGGMVNCNASGACSYAYGSIRNYIQRLKIVFANGTTKEFLRGGGKCVGRACRVDLDGAVLSFALPDYDFWEPKNSAGYYAKEDMELIDLFIGSEGTLGVVTEVDVRIIPAPKEKWGCVCFFAEEAEMQDFVDAMKTLEFAQVKLAALEYIDENALKLIEAMRQRISSFERIPEIGSGYCGAIYFELHGGGEGEMIDAIDRIVNVLKGCGGSLDDTWMASDLAELQKLKLFRHAVPEGANALMREYKANESSLTTICTDMAVRQKDLRNMIRMYKQDLLAEGIHYIMYGHIGNNHLHVNILPRNKAEYETGMKLYHQWAKTVAGWGGTISAEHGIGKQKAAMIGAFFKEQDLAKMYHIKRMFDSNGILNRGNIFQTVF